ncbi:hypothetical protein WN51_11811 [Melipona quadrifasciata]|uniref:Uncharacterized protein n=1 Tax=Melipona quadrifasciata TaxID=166423 RepID=A0A0M9A455_9HYME|nr:hypothetical protein WN51_11811 [Melipona quadrifasciata]
MREFRQLFDDTVLPAELLRLEYVRAHTDTRDSAVRTRYYTVLYCCSLKRKRLTSKNDR